MPKLPPSEIFQAYAQIAQDKGLVKSAQDSKALKDYKNSDYPRVGSDDISKIEALYGIKPDAPKSMQYENNIAEDAHPNQVIIAPSYDKLNGLIENINERQRIIINIMNKPVNGHLTQKKYASDLVNELVKVATDLDNRNLDQLRNLADTCILQLNEMSKVAIAPLVIAAVAAAVLGAAYLYNHINDPDKGLLKNVENAITQIDDLIGEDWFHSTFYATLKPEFLSNLKKLRADLQSLKVAAEEFNGIEEKMHQLKTMQELIATSQDHGQEIVHKAEEFRQFLKNIAPEINQAIALFSDAKVRDLAIKDETWFSGLVSKIEPIFHGAWGLFSDRFDDIKHALIPLKESMDATVKEIDRIDGLSATRQQQVESALNQAKQYQPKPTVQTPEMSAAEKPATFEGFEQAIKELAGS